MLLRAGDSLVLFTDGVIEARRPPTADGRREPPPGFLATLHDMSAGQIADALQQASLTFSGGKTGDDTVALVLRFTPL